MSIKNVIMTLTEFINTDPGLGNISLLRDDFNNITNLTINRTDCNLSTYDSSLGQLTGLLIELNDTLTVVVENVTNYTGYYHLEVTSLELTGSIDEDICRTVTLTPFDEATNLVFRNSVFYPTFNNVPETLYMTSNAASAIYNTQNDVRRGKTIQDVDRKKDAIVPTNINLLLAGTANLAEFPESNYSSLSNITARYLGSKTSIKDYGTEPAIAASMFRGSIYIKSKTNTAICSQSYDERIIEELLFAPNPLVTGLTNTEYPDVRLTYPMSKSLADETFTTSSTVINIYQDVDFQAGDIIRRVNGTELMKVVSNTKTSAPVSSSIEVERGYFSEYITDSPDNWTAGVTPLNFAKVLGDTIYSPETSIPYRVAGKKIWVEETQEVIVVDTYGTVISKETTCD